jgi:HEAT repeat protein
VELATASSITQEALFDLLAMLLKNGLAEGRRTSCAALTRFNTPEANQLVRLAMDDPDSGVQAAAVRQLRRRGFADALDLLVSFLDSSAGEVRDTARSLLAEFNFVRYCAMFDLLDDDAARSTGLLVHKVDHAAVDGLLDDLASPSVSTRLRAIEMAVAMQATDDVSHQLLALTTSDNAMVRQSAVEALGYCSAPNLVDTLKSEAKDPHQPVSTDATYSLQRLP